MGHIVENIKRSQFALGIKTVLDGIERPAFLSFDDLPYLPPAPQTLLDKSTNIVEDMRADAEAKREAEIDSRYQGGVLVPEGTPDLAELRQRRDNPEEARGAVVNDKA